MKRISRNDIVFLAILALAALCLAVFFYGRRASGTSRVVVTVNQEVYGTYDLSDDREVEIVVDGIATNRFVIRDGKADMTEADCPDKLCVHQRAIRNANETIVCLPNKVVIQIVGEEEGEIDSIAK